MEEPVDPYLTKLQKIAKALPNGDAWPINELNVHLSRYLHSPQDADALEKLVELLSEILSRESQGFDEIAKDIILTLAEKHCDFIRRKLREILKTEETLPLFPDIAAPPKIAHELLLVLATLYPTNEKDTPIDEDSLVDHTDTLIIPDEKRIYVSTGYCFNIDWLIKFHNERPLRRGETAENKPILDTRANSPFHPRDAYFIETFCSDRKIFVGHNPPARAAVPDAAAQQQEYLARMAQGHQQGQHRANRCPGAPNFRNIANFCSRNGKAAFAKFWPSDPIERAARGLNCLQVSTIFAVGGTVLSFIPAINSLTLQAVFTGLNIKLALGATLGALTLPFLVIAAAVLLMVIGVIYHLSARYALNNNNAEVVQQQRY